MMLMFAHGFAIHFGQIKPPANIDVAMIAPKGTRTYRKKRIPGRKRRSLPDRSTAGCHRKGT